MQIFVSVLAILAFGNTLIPTEASGGTLKYDFYEESCPAVGKIVFEKMKSILEESQYANAPAQLLRLFFHDCFIEGCDASILLETKDGNHSVEIDAIPNRSLKGFEIIDVIKEELEKQCPGIVSCADVLALATRDSLLMSHGLYYPLNTGRRDSQVSFHDKAMAEIPKPSGTIDETLDLFSSRGFSARETVALLGSHNIGKISCRFIQSRFGNDPLLPREFEDELKLKCQGGNVSISNISEQPVISSSSASSSFGTNYYDKLTKQRGLLFSDQQLIANEETMNIVQEYASDDGTKFRKDFSQAMLKMSNIVKLSSSQGEVRKKCSAMN